MSNQTASILSGVSVIVCCYNSGLRLPETLKHLGLQNVPANIAWEIIIVNNASSDNTIEIAMLEWAKNERKNISFKIVNQPIPGLRFAREMGVAESRYNCLIFCDDDNWLFENYVENAFNTLNMWPDAGVIGGYGIERPEKSLPEWFNNYFTLYAVGGQNEYNGIIERNCPYVYGAAIVVRKSAYQKLLTMGFKFKTIGRIQEKLSSGEDVELCFAIKLLGFNIAYSAELRYYHFIAESRFTDKYLSDLMYQLGCCDIFHRPYYWLLTRNLPGYKKNWIWVLFISVNLYLLSLIKSLQKGNSLNNIIRKMNLENAKGRLSTIIRLNRSVDRYYKQIKLTLTNT